MWGEEPGARMSSMELENGNGNGNENEMRD